MQLHVCDFCGKNETEVSRIITSSKADICNECVSICVEILLKETFKLIEFDDKGKIKDKVELENRLQEFKLRCPYKTICFDERTEFDGCSKNGNGYGRNADECKVCIECLTEHLEK